MRRSLAVIAVSAAAACAFSLNANAAAKAPIRTYTEQASIAFTGIGPDQGFYSKGGGAETVVLSPRLALASTSGTSNRLSGKVHNTSSRFDIVGSHTYVKQGSGRWVIGTLTAKVRADDEQALNPYTSLARFDQLPGVRRVSPGHYRVTGPLAKLGPFVRYEWGLAANAFEGSGIKTLTVTAVLDSGGRPVTFTASGRSANNVLTATETFGHYNKPVTIAAP
ncbi:MAG: hypothetical protein ABSB59_13995 [Streptosporangiaceae bacterium]|jgi:hypothetical protein